MPRPRRREQWRDGPSGTASLTQTGNWLQYTAATVGTTDLDVAATFRDNNQYASRDADGGGSTNKDYAPGYDKAGNLTDDDTRTPTSTYTDGYQYVYDGWNRLVTIKSQTGNTVEEFRYNGLGHRIGWHYDTTRSGGGAPDGTVDSNDPWFYFQYNERWQQVAMYQGSNTHPSEQFVHHQAGRDGPWTEQLCRRGGPARAGHEHRRDDRRAPVLPSELAPGRGDDPAGLRPHGRAHPL